jgi:dinuclear metal center YbgI/SA1388 family protein
VKTGELIDKLNRRLPLYLAESWDNPGVMVGDPDIELKGILVALDYDEKVLDFALKNNINFIFTHHPLIFSPLKNMYAKGFIPKALQKMIKNDITLYCAHTNLDSIPGGVNDVLAELIGLQDIIPLEEAEWDGEGSAGTGRTGVLAEPQSLKDFAGALKKKLHLDCIQVTGDPERIIKKVALCGGSGSRLASKAVSAGCDILVTGDVGYHNAQDAIRLDIAMIDGTHYGTEVIVLDRMMEIAEKECASKVPVMKVDQDLNTFYYL